MNEMRIVAFEHGTGYLCPRDTYLGRQHGMGGDPFSDIGSVATKALSATASVGTQAAAAATGTSLWLTIADVGVATISAALPAFAAVVGAGQSAKRANSQAAAQVAAQLRQQGLQVQQQSAQIAAVAAKQRQDAEAVKSMFGIGTMALIGLAVIGGGGYIVYRIARKRR